MGRTYIGDVLEELGFGGAADQELEFGPCGAEPEDADKDRQDYGTGGVDPPSVVRVSVLQTHGGRYGPLLVRR